MEKSPIQQQITFLHTEDLTATRHFYETLLGLPLARDQGRCLIFQVTETAFLGFCEHIEPTPPGRSVILTLVTDDVDGSYQRLSELGVKLMEPPKHNPTFGITHFFLHDPDGYWVEIQRFDDPL